MQEMRFKIQFVDVPWHPWELYECVYVKEKSLLGRLFRVRVPCWKKLLTFETRKEAEERIRQIIDGEKKQRPVYYDQNGTRVCEF